MIKLNTGRVSPEKFRGHLWTRYVYLDDEWMENYYGVHFRYSHYQRCYEIESELRGLLGIGSWCSVPNLDLKTFNPHASVNKLVLQVTEKFLDGVYT